MSTYFADVTLFDGRSVRRRQGLLASEGRISWAGSHTRAPKDARKGSVVEGSGRTLTPGLIDCHVHLCFDGGADFVAEAAVTEAYAAVKCVGNAARQIAPQSRADASLGRCQPQQFSRAMCQVLIR